MITEITPAPTTRWLTAAEATECRRVLRLTLPEDLEPVSSASLAGTRQS